MQPLGAIDALKPALDRTRAVLAHPFRLGRSWKLAFCAYLALSGCLFIPLPLFVPFFPAVPFPPAMWFFAAGVTLLLFAFFYLGSRMQFVLFDLVLTLDGRIASLWRLRHRSLIWQWIGIKLAFTLPLALVVFLPLASSLRNLFVLLGPSLVASRAGAESSAAPASLDPQLLVRFVSFYAVLLAGLSVLFLASSLLSDFVLPVLALEGGGTRAALSRSIAIVRADVWATVGFVALEVLLAVCGLIAQYVVATVLSLLAAIPLGVFGVLGYLLLHSVAPPLVLTAGGVALYVVFLLTTMYLQLGTFGTLMVFLRSFSLFYVAGRYGPLTTFLGPYPGSFAPAAGIPAPGPPPLPFPPASA